MVNENWKEYGPPFTEFNEELTEQWKNAGGLGFSLNVVRDWLNIGLKATDADFAYWLELNGYSPEWVLSQGNPKDLRKKYRKFVRKQPKEKKPKVVQEEPRDLRKCKICDNNTFHTFKEWQRYHGERKLNLKEPWITVIRRPFIKDKNYSSYTEYITMCGDCKVLKIPHLSNCIWFTK